MKALNAVHLHKTFGNTKAVDDLSFSIEEGTMYGLLGPNGAGKSTTIRMIMQIILPDAGRIELFGAPACARHLDAIGYLPEERGLYRKMKILEALKFFGELKGLPAGEAEKRSRHWLSRLDMEEVMLDKVETLSKGNQQKIQLIITLLHEPKLLILDEPFSGLDPINTTRVKDMLMEIKRSGCCLIISTHLMEHVEKLCDAITLINRGKSIVSGPLTDIKQSFGKNTLLLEYKGTADGLKTLDFVNTFDDYGQYAEITLNDMARSSDFLKAALDHVEVLRFERIEPTLNQIFIEAVNEEQP